MDKKSIFIGGCDRSGTTMLGSMLGMGTGCVTTPESFFKMAVCFGDQDGMEMEEVGEVLRKVGDDFRFRLWKSPVPDAKYFRDRKITPYREIILSVVNEYAKKVGKSEWTTWIDHTPTNLRHRYLLKGFFRESKFIHIVRDGRAIAASIMPLSWGPNTIYYTAKWWAENISMGLAAEYGFPDDVCLVKYEDLVLYPENTLKKLCKFSGIPFEFNMINGLGFVVPRYTRKQHSLIGKKPDKQRIQVWKHRLKSREIEIFESMAGEILLSLGYGMEHKTPSPITSREIWKSRATEITKVVINKIVDKKRKGLALFSN